MTHPELVGLEPKLNVERILMLAELLENRRFEEDLGFDMKNYWCSPSLSHVSGFTRPNGDASIMHECKTAGCMAGWYCHVAGLKPETMRSYEIFREARGGLGLLYKQALALFEPQLIGYKHKAWFTPERCAKVLRHLAETGTVNWNVAE